jgi:hypothetical protein
MRKFLIAPVLAGAIFAAAPASAQWGAYGQGQIQGEIGQLANQITRAQQRGTISPREANGLRRQAVQLQQNYRVLARNGLTQREHALLQRQVQQIRFNLRAERRDSDRRRG